MTDLDRTVTMRPGALTVRSATPHPRTEVMTAAHGDYWVLVAEAAAQEKAGRIKRLNRTPVWSHERNRYEMRVRRLKAPRRTMPAWAIPVISAVSLAGATAVLGWAALRAVTLLDGPSLMILCGAAVGWLAAVIRAGRQKRG